MNGTNLLHTMGSFVYVTMFICSGMYTTNHLTRWWNMFNGHQRAILLVGKCTLPATINASQIHRIPTPKGINHYRYRYVSAKSGLWRLPYKQLVYYDMDIHIKPPVNRCAKLCPTTAILCAVRDPVATWPVRRKDYFNSGFMVLKPSNTIADQLDALTDLKFGDQNKINVVFRGKWSKLPKRCNWLNYKENHPSAKTDSNVWATHEHIR
jgi:hypothetical protein